MSNDTLNVQTCPRSCQVHQDTREVKCSNIWKTTICSSCSVLRCRILQLLLYSLQIRSHSCLLESQQIPELHWWQFQSLPCTLLPTLSFVGLRLLPGQFSELQLAAMQSQTLPQLSQECLLGLVMAAGPAQAIEPGSPGIRRINYCSYYINNTEVMCCLCRLQKTGNLRELQKQNINSYNGI